MASLCENDTHIVQKLPSGEFICVQCGQIYREHHEIIIAAGVTAAPKTR
jgi:hypothetical protein